MRIQCSLQMLKEVRDCFLKVVALKGFPFMVVPLFQQSLISSPSRPHCSGFFCKHSVFSSSSHPSVCHYSAISSVWHEAGCPHRELCCWWELGLWLVSVEFPGSQKCFCRLQELSDVGWCSFGWLIPTKHYQASLYTALLSSKLLEERLLKLEPAWYPDGPLRLWSFVAIKDPGSQFRGVSDSSSPVLTLSPQIPFGISAQHFFSHCSQFCCGDVLPC